VFSAGPKLAFLGLKFPLGFLEDKTIYRFAQAVAGLRGGCRFDKKRRAGAFAKRT